MKKGKDPLRIDAHKHPNVLLVGNGIIKLSDKETATGWDELIKKLMTRKGDINIESIPYAMQPEALCGVDVEKIQRNLSENLCTLQNIHHLVNKLIGLPFDAIITTNYTYEIEMVLSGKKWTANDRKKAFTALDGNSKVNHNTFICNTVKTMDGKTIPVFHIHGECERKHSMILSYYSYSKALAHLVSYNKLLGNKLYECQQEGETYNCKCWLDYYLMGNVWSVGFGFDFSEFDIWWATERKAREKADHGKLKVYMCEADQGFASKKDLLNAMDADCCIYNTDEIGFERMYEKVIEDIKADMKV